MNDFTKDEHDLFLRLSKPIYSIKDVQKKLDDEAKAQGYDSYEDMMRKMENFKVLLQYSCENLKNIDFPGIRNLKFE